MTQCTQQTLEFHHLGRREVTASATAQIAVIPPISRPLFCSSLSAQVIFEE